MRATPRAGPPRDRVIVVAPIEAEWASRAEHDLRTAHMLIARLYEPNLLSLFVLSGGLHAIAIDSRLAIPSLRVLRGCMSSKSTIKMVLVHEGTNAIEAGPLRSRPWPTDFSVIRTFLELP